MIILLTGLQSVPQHLYEAASIDGAPRLAQFWRITLPMLRPSLFLCAVVGILNSFTSFDLVYVMTGGGPGHATELLITYIYKAGFGQTKFDYAAAPMPYYPDVPGAPQNSIIGGASLWVMGGKKAEEYKGVARFFAFLSDTDRQAKLHTESGYLPITKAAYEKTKADGFYEKNPILEVPVKSLTNKEPTENSRGVRLINLPQLRDIQNEEFEAMLAGQQTAQHFGTKRKPDDDRYDQGNGAGQHHLADGSLG